MPKITLYMWLVTWRGEISGTSSRVSAGACSGDRVARLTYSVRSSSWAMASRG